MRGWLDGWVVGWVGGWAGGGWLGGGGGARLGVELGVRIGRYKNDYACRGCYMLGLGIQSRLSVRSCNIPFVYMP